MSNQNTVEISEGALSILVGEAEMVFDSITDDEWHKGYGENVKKSIVEANKALNE